MAEPRTRYNFRLPDTLMDRVSAVAGPRQKTAFVEKAIEAALDSAEGEHRFGCPHPFCHFTAASATAVCATHGRVVQPLP